MMRSKSNGSLAISLAALVLGMLGLAYASVPLYRLFCQVTGFGGTPQQALHAPGRIIDRPITIRFNADIDAGLPWEFRPGEPTLTLKPGEERMTYYTARNLANQSTTGHATYNVVPDKAGAYFAKIECFCFKNQSLGANQKVHMPVVFFIDPAIADDPEMADVRTITLSYTFFAAKK